MLLCDSSCLCPNRQTLSMFFFSENPQMHKMIQIIPFIYKDWFTNQVSLDYTSTKNHVKQFYMNIYKDINGGRNILSNYIVKCRASSFVIFHILITVSDFTSCYSCRKYCALFNVYSHRLSSAKSSSAETSFRVLSKLNTDATHESKRMSMIFRRFVALFQHYDGR